MSTLTQVDLVDLLAAPVADTVQTLLEDGSWKAVLFGIDDAGECLFAGSGDYWEDQRDTRVTPVNEHFERAAVRAARNVGSTTVALGVPCRFQPSESSDLVFGAPWSIDLTAGATIIITVGPNGMDILRHQFQIDDDGIKFSTSLELLESPTTLAEVGIGYYLLHEMLEEL